MKDGFILQCKYKERFARWGAEKGYAILMAIFEYEETGSITLPDSYYDAFEPIKEDLDAKRKAYEERCRQNAENGAKGGRPKKTEQNPQKPTETEKSKRLSEKPKKADKDKDKDKEKDKDISLYGFEEFWGAYPRKVGKPTARKAWEKLNMTPDLLDKMLKAIQSWKRSEQWQEERYIPHPTTWLNQERWNDEPPKPKKGHGEYIQREIKTNERFGLEYITEADDDDT